MNRVRLVLAAGIAVALAMAATVVAGPVAKLPANQAGSRGIYIQYDNVLDNIDQAHGFSVAGGHMRWAWKSLEPTRGTRLFESAIRPFISQQAERGKKAALGIETFVGRINVSPPYGSLAVPQWLWTQYPSVAPYNTVSNDGWHVLNFLDPNYQARYAEFINALADWLAANPTLAANVGWIEMGVGMYSETQPSDQWVTRNKPDYDYYATRAPGGESPPGWTGNDWRKYVNWCTDTYYHAFRERNPGLASIPIFLNCAPDFKSQRTAFTDYAARKGVGLKNNGLQADRYPATLYQPLDKWWSSAPIALETYEQWLTNETKLYWGVLCALDKHADVLEPDRWLLIDRDKQPRANYVAIWNWAAPFLGVDVWTTPSVWCALRDSQFGSGERGNFEFFLSQGDTYGPNGVTVAVTEDDITPGVKEGRYTRRTNQASGHTNMWFRIADQYVNGNASRERFVVNVTYLDRGRDTWALTYDSLTGEKQAGLVTKDNTNTWKKATFVLDDARFGNGIGTQADLRLDSMGDGDDFFHMVEVQKSGDAVPTPTPTPTPTSTPVLCGIDGRVALQGRPAAPHVQWSVPITVKVGGTVYEVTTDNEGGFTLSGLPPGDYDIQVKGAHTLSNIRRNVTLGAGVNTLDMGTLLEGDSDDNDRVDSSDFGILRRSYFMARGQPGYFEGADFDHDGVVNSADFALLRSNYFRSGPVELTIVAGVQPAELSGAMGAGITVSAP
jgi:hypothetical protein